MATNRSTFKIRPARPEDAAEVAPLMYDAMEDIAHTIAGTTDLPATFDALEELFRLNEGRLSFANTLICEDDSGRAAGFLLSYGGDDAKSLDEPLLRRLQERGLPTDGLVPEARPGEYYLDSLAVSGAYRGAGIGTRLIQAFEERAASLGWRQTMLVVERENIKARALYERLGYREDGSIELSGHLYDRMVKSVETE